MLDFERQYVLENKRVILRPLAATDLSELLHFSLEEPELWTYSLVSAGGGEEQMRHYIELALEGRAQKREYPYIVFDKQSNCIAGSTRFYDIQLPFQSLQLGYTWYGRNFQGTGLNQNCKYLLLEFAFEKLGMERVEFRADNRNVRSIAAMKSIGCVEEGILRSNMPTSSGQARRDSIVLSILKSEWNADIKENLLQKLK